MELISGVGMFVSRSRIRMRCCILGRAIGHFPNMRFLGFNWVEPDMEDVFLAYSRGYYRPDVNQEEPAKMALKV